MAVQSFESHATAGEAATQAEVFRDVQPVVDAVWEKGYNGTILAYGQTGSGKTHTLIVRGHGAELTQLMHFATLHSALMQQP